jgi:uncharacterized protein
VETEINFTWNPEKAKRNHGVSFETAKQVFADPFVVILEDCEDKYGEMSYHAIDARSHKCC